MEEDTLTEIGLILHDILTALQDKTSTDDMSGVLADIKTGIAKFNAKEVPDVSKPIVEAFTKLETAFRALEVKSPDVNVAAPNVQVEAPRVDLSGIETILKTDIPAAFDQAIAAIPQPEKPSPIDWTPITDLLKSIDTQTRLTPVSNPLTATQLADMTLSTTNAISLFNKPYDQFAWSNPDANDNYQILTSLLHGNVQNVVSLTYDLNSNVTNIQRTT